MTPVLLDTSVIVALLDRSENLHEACVEAVQELKEPLITCEAVIAESCYLLRNSSGAPEAVIENIAAGILQIPFQLSRESAGVKHLLRNTATVILIWPMRACFVWRMSLGGRYTDPGPRFRHLPLGKEQAISNVAESGASGAVIRDKAA